MYDCNFNIKNGLAYTEDSILVYNIFVYKISSKVTKKDCEQYLTKFGETVRFQYKIKPGSGRRRGSRHAFVHYKNAETAAKVLEKQVHSISPGKVLSVKACDSWYQPNFPNKDFEADKPNVGTNILDLNEDCILIIFKKLQLRDQVSLASSHVQFELIFKEYAKTHYKSMSTDQLDQMSLWNIRQLFLYAGKFFENFTIIEWFQRKDRERIASFMQFNCRNLKKIKLDTAKIRVPSLHKILTNKPKLKVLILNCLSINDHAIHALKKTPSLEHLSIAHCYNFTGRFLYLLPHLKTLRLSQCCNLKTAHLQKAICAMPNLVALDITGAERLNEEIFDSLASKNDLEILQMSCIDGNYESVAKITKLRSLGISCVNAPLSSLSVNFFRMLAEQRADKLESLQIISRQSLNNKQCDYIAQLKALKKLHVPCNAGITDYSLKAFCELKNLVELKLNGSQNFTNDALFELVCGCPKLKWVNIRNTAIDNRFAKQLLSILKKEKRKNGKITFLVFGSKMNEYFDLPQDFQNDEMKSVVEFVFKNELLTLKSYDNLYDDFENDYNGLEEAPFFESENVATDSDDDYDDDADDFGFHDDDDDDDEVDLLLNMPIFEHFAMRQAFRLFGYHDPDDDAYLW